MRESPVFIQRNVYLVNLNLTGLATNADGLTPYRLNEGDPIDRDITSIFAIFCD